MTQQEDGWPLGLRLLNARVGLARNGSVSFNTLLTASSNSSADFSSDLDTESTGSFFHEKSITLGSLMGASNILELSRRSVRGRTGETLEDKKNNIYRSKPWVFSLCSKLCTDAVTMTDNAPSLGHYLEAERRAAANNCRRIQYSTTTYGYGPNDFSPVRPSSESNFLFVNGRVGPPSSGEESRGRSARELL